MKYKFVIGDKVIVTRIRKDENEIVDYDEYINKVGIITDIDEENNNYPYSIEFDDYDDLLESNFREEELEDYIINSLLLRDEIE